MRRRDRKPRRPVYTPRGQARGVLVSCMLNALVFGAVGIVAAFVVGHDNPWRLMGWSFTLYAVTALVAMKLFCGMRLLPRSRKAGNGRAVVRG